MITSYCQVCFNSKTPDRYGEPNCLDCQTRLDQAAEAAKREGQDPEAAKRAAADTLRPHPMRGRDPRQWFPRIDTSRFDARLAQSGTPDDPRIGGHK